jgi:rhodanese-related sulfurtransferase
MNRLLEYTTNHPFLVAAAAILAVLTFVIEMRNRGRGTQVGPMDAVRLINGGALVIDVRDAKDYEAGHIGDARSVPASEIGSRAEGFKKHKEKPVLLYCESGFASATAAKVLRAQGFTKVVTLRGGLQGWRQENLPLVKGSAKRG